MDRREWDERYGASEQTFPLGPNRLVEAEVAGMRPGRALDLACGEGRHAVWLAGLGWRVVAVDFSVVGLARGRARAQAEDVEVAWAVADVHDLRLPPGCFELVLASFFHPRPPDRTGLLASAARSLTPGGTLLLVSYDIANLTEGTGGPQDPDLLLRPAELATELEALGLRVARADTVRLRTPTKDGTEVDVVDAVIRAVRPESQPPPSSPGPAPTVRRPRA